VKRGFVYKACRRIYKVNFSGKDYEKEEQPSAQCDHFSVTLTPVQRTTIIASGALIVLIGIITGFSEQVHLDILGLFCQLLGGLLLGLGLIKTNDELVDMIRHHEQLDKPSLVKHLTKDRFFIVLGVFYTVLGLLLQIISNQIFI
jgi:hypothetical protein